MTETSQNPPRIFDRLRRALAVALATISVLTLTSVGPSDTARAEPPARAAISANGTGGRVATVGPGVELTNEVVTVSWSGFRPTTQQNVYTVIILQCRANPVSLSDCYRADPFPDLANGNRVLDFTASDGTGSGNAPTSRPSSSPITSCPPMPP